jgi:hypothetical protein
MQLRSNIFLKSSCWKKLRLRIWVCAIAEQHFLKMLRTAEESCDWVYADMYR